jgi:hypothetical protein
MGEWTRRRESPTPDPAYGARVPAEVRTAALILTQFGEGKRD